MATKTIALNLKINTRTGQASIKKVSKDIKNLGTDGEKAAKKMTISWKAATVAVTAFSAAVIASTKGFIDAYAEQEQAEKRLATVIEATGHAAGFTADELYEMAADMQKVTTYGDEMTISAMAIIATFKNIKGDAFERTAMAAMDLSTVLGQDLKASVLMIAKALNDPIANLGALGRAGVQFTETQKGMIKSLAETGQHAKAMGIILDELESQQGGAAKAAREGTGIWKAFSNAIGDVNEVVGKHLHEALAPTVKKTLDWIEANEELIGLKVKEWVDSVKGEVTLLGKAIGFVIKHLETLMYILGIIATIKIIAWAGPLVSWLVKIAIVTGDAIRKIKDLGGRLKFMIKGLKHFRYIFYSTVPWIVLIANKIKVLALTIGTATGAALAFGVVIGTLLNKLKIVQKGAQHVWNAIFFVIKYSMIKSELSFLQTIERIKVGWKELKDWFIQTFPEMAQFMEMEKSVTSYNLRITTLKGEIEALKDEYITLMYAIEDAFAVGTKPAAPGKKGVGEADEDEIGPASAAGIKRAEAWFAEWERLEKENQVNRIKIKHEGYQQAVSLLMLEKQAFIDMYGEQEAITEHFQLKLGVLSKAEEERSKLAEIEIAKLKAENHEKILSYISTEIENKKRAIAQEVAMLANLTENEELRTAILQEGQVRLNAIDVEAAATKLATQQSFYNEYNELTMSQFELEREQLAEHIELKREMWEEAGITKNEIERLVSEKTLDIARREQMAKLAIYSNVAGQIANTFSMIAQAGGKHSKAAFLMYKAFAIAQAIISTHMAIVKTLAEPALPYPSNVAMAKVIGAMGIAKVAMIAAQKPPSYDQGGISNAKGIYQTGNIAEAHIPIPSGGKIPVEIGDKEGGLTPQEINIVNVFNPDMLDEFLASSSGQDAIINVIDNKAQAVKRILR